jgi:hypothetical protein
MRQKTILLLLISTIGFKSYSQKIELEQIKEANSYLLHNLECIDIIETQDRMIDVCDSSKTLLKQKVSQSNTLVKIQESIINGQQKEWDKTKTDLTKVDKRRKFWKRFTLVMIGENMIIGLFVYLTIAGI